MIPMSKNDAKKAGFAVLGMIAFLLSIHRVPLLPGISCLITYIYRAEVAQNPNSGEDAKNFI